MITFPTNDEFEQAGITRSEADPTFRVDIDGYEGPLDLLLTLARKQQVDLAHVSILALADQYLRFIESARALRLELAADYLVMAAWLAYLKSRLLLPREAKDEPSSEVLVEELTLRLQRLQAIRLTGQALMERNILYRDVFDRGSREAPVENASHEWQATMYDLLSAYAQVRGKKASAFYALEKRNVWSLAEARSALERLIGRVVDWMPIDGILAPLFSKPEDRKTARASAFAASLELAREGEIELRQDRPFAPLYLKKRASLALI